MRGAGVQTGGFGHGLQRTAAMNFSSEMRDGVLVVCVDGAVDHASAGEFERSLLPLLGGAAPGSRVVLDLGGVDYMSSVGLRVLMLAAKQGRSSSLAISVAGLQPALREIFQISRFDKLYAVHDSVQSALAAPGSG
jgi:anti-anti-sigma factor